MNERQFTDATPQAPQMPATQARRPAAYVWGLDLTIRRVS